MNGNSCQTDVASRLAALHLLQTLANCKRLARKARDGFEMARERSEPDSVEVGVEVEDESDDDGGVVVLVKVLLFKEHVAGVKIDFGRCGEDGEGEVAEGTTADWESSSASALFKFFKMRTRTSTGRGFEY
jgi:hypothetical protein